MGIVIGIDVGGSTTKIVGINKGQIQSPMFITATDPVTSLFGAFGKYIYGRFYKFKFSLASSQNLIKATANVILFSQI